MEFKLSSVAAAVMSVSALAAVTTVHAQDTQTKQDAQTDEDVEVIQVSGIRTALANALNEKRESDNLIEVIQAEDIGKLPDQNLAEVLENITGIQITREAGVGTGVQIRGTASNRTEINGVSALGSGFARAGISFEDLSATIISAVEVTKAPDAKTIEGSVGGTINLKTIRPLELNKTLIATRVQGENSDLSADDDTLPRLSATFGDNWAIGGGKFGAVISASYAEQDVSAFRPRVDRDGLVLPTDTGDHVLDDAFLRIQFFDQDYDNFEYETLNFAGSFEWAPNDNTKFWFDAILSDQERKQESTRVQLSGVSDNVVVRNTDNQTFETINLGTLNGPDGSKSLGSILAVTSGDMPYNPNDIADDPNFRTSSDTGARITDSTIFRIGGAWQGNRLSASIEASLSVSDSSTPDFSTTMDFINPLTAQPGTDTPGVGGVDNATPLTFDLTGGALTFGILQNTPYTPTTAQFLDPVNYSLRDVNIGRDISENEEVAFRADFSYEISSTAITSIDFGYRFNESSSFNQDQGVSFRYRSGPNDEGPRDIFRPSADQFSAIVKAGPNNFNAADGRALYIRDFLIIDPEISFSDPEAVIATLNNAIAAQNAKFAGEGANMSLLTIPDVEQLSVFDISEDTNALYAQVNFEYGIFRGNAGLRYVETEINSRGNSELNDEISEVVSTGSYNFLLPRINVVANVSDDLLIRSGYGQDIRRPNFNLLSTSTTFPGSSNDPVAVGNPDLAPEEVTSFDLSFEWYFAPAAVFSAGLFHKERTELHTQITEVPAANIVDGQVNRDTSAPCEDGGIFNPVADYGVNAPGAGNGICVPLSSTFNAAGSTTQQGIEFAFQYDLSNFEEQLGWASGFGFIANFTLQEFDVDGDEFLEVSGGSRNIFNLLDPFTDADLSNLQTENILPSLSEKAYNFTLFYEKHGLQARARYTWRDAFRSLDDDFFGLQVVEEARGQLNASVYYNVDDSLSIGFEGINLTQSDAEQSCVNEGALLCFQDLTDRRVLLGVNYRFQ